MRLTRRITAQNRVAIPKRIRELLNIEAGDLIEVEFEREGRTAPEVLSAMRDGQLHLPEALRRALDASAGDIVTLTIKNVNKRRI
mgnify:CR=1 FL=1